MKELKHIKAQLCMQEQGVSACMLFRYVAAAFH
jgi:hypothetical protein